MRIVIETIPHSEQRYETVGDWQIDEDDDDITIRVSDTGAWKSNVAIAVHELVEAILCSADGISQDVVDSFDRKFESARKPGDMSEPGDAKNCPYNVHHGVATGVERILVAAMDYSWEQHTQAIEAL